jgi:hypothetical protein
MGWASEHVGNFSLRHWHIQSSRPSVAVYPAFRGSPSIYVDPRAADPIFPPSNPCRLLHCSFPLNHFHEITDRLTRMVRSNPMRMNPTTKSFVLTTTWIITTQAAIPHAHRSPIFPTCQFRIAIK